MAELWFGPAELAERLGVSVKALRVYERAGLVTPARTAAGWRAYGPDQQARLHQVLVLKRLGLTLARIGELLGGKLASLDAVLALQQQVLESRRAETDEALRLLAAARGKLARDGALSPDDLTQLTRETAMSDKMSDVSEAEWERLMQPHVDKHFTLEEQQAIRARKGEFDQAEVTREWEVLVAEAQRLQAQGDPDAPEARDLARRWMAQVRKFTGDDPTLVAKSAQVNMDAAADPAVRPQWPFDRALMTFVGEAYRRSQAEG